MNCKLYILLLLIGVAYVDSDPVKFKDCGSDSRITVSLYDVSG